MNRHDRQAELELSHDTMRWSEYSLVLHTRDLPSLPSLDGSLTVLLLVHRLPVFLLGGTAREGPYIS